MRMIITAAAALAVTVAACGGAGSSQSPQPGASTATATAPPAAQATVPTSPSAAVLARRLKSAGLPVTGLITYTAASDPNHLLGRQNGYTSKVAWQDPRAIAAGAGQPSSDPGGTEFGGGIEVFPDAASAQARYQELKGFAPPFGDSADPADHQGLRSWMVSTPSATWTGSTSSKTSVLPSIQWTVTTSFLLTGGL